MSRFEFELDGAEVAERGVQPLAIVPTFDVLEDGGASLGPRGELPIGAFSLEGAEKAFHRRIVEAIADTAHADLAVMGSQALLINIAGVLTALVGVMQQISRWRALRDCHMPGPLH